MPEKDLKQLDKNNAPRWVKEEVCRNYKCNSTCLFGNVVEASWMPRNQLGSLVQNDSSTSTDLRLRTVDTIKGIVSEFIQNDRGKLWHESEASYETMTKAVNYAICQRAEELRNRHSNGGESFIERKTLGQLIDAGFIGAYMESNDFNNDKIHPRGFNQSPRDTAFKKFCEMFDLNI